MITPAEYNEKSQEAALNAQSAKVLGAGNKIAEPKPLHVEIKPVERHEVGVPKWSAEAQHAALSKAQIAARVMVTEPDRVPGPPPGNSQAIQTREAQLTECLAAVVRQLYMSDFHDKHGHNAKMLKPVCDAVVLLTGNGQWA